MDASRRVRLIQRVEVNACNVFIEKIAALLGCPVNTDIFDRFRIAAATIDRLQKARGETRSRRKISHPTQSGRTCHWHDARDDRYANSCEIAARAPVVKRVVVEEQLRDDVVGACVDFRLEMLDLHERVRCFWMAFGEAGHTNSEASSVIHAEPLTLATNKRDEIGCLLKIPERKNARARRRIAAQREDVSNARRRVHLKDASDLVLRMAKAGQVRNRLEARLAPKPHDKAVRVVTRRTAGAVRHRDKTRRERLELSDRTVERLEAGVGLRREELETQRRRVTREDVRDVHSRRVAKALDLDQSIAEHVTLFDIPR